MASIPPVRSAAVPRKQDRGRVVREIDVHLSNELTESIRLVQYPLQQADSQQMPICGARLKPRHNILQIDQDMPVLPSRHYEHHEQNFSSMTTRTFQSQTIPVETHLCLGKMRKQDNGETVMYLVPVQSISQMRPTMHHIHGDSVPSDDAAAKGDDDAAEEEKGILKPITYQRKESERAAELRKSSYSYKKNSEAAEEWQRLEVVPDDSEQTQETLKKLFRPQAETRQPRQLSGKSKRDTTPEADYVGTLNYMPSASSSAVAAPISDDPKAIVARLTVLLRQGLPIPYSLLRAQLPARLAEQKVLDALTVCAVMVRGNFCLHSQFVSLPRELQRVRTFMLSLLQSQGLIRRKCLERVFASDERVSSEKLYTLLKLMAKQTENGWVLRLEDDTRFVADNPAYVAIHQRYWNNVSASQKHKDLLEMYNDAMSVDS